MIVKDLYLLEIFTSVAKTLSFSKTAEQFNASQSFISKKISQLESNLQASLFVRTTRTVKLSESGRKVLPVAIRILEESMNLNQVLSDSINSSDVAGEITISASETYANARLVPFISKFTSKFPKMSINLKLSNQYHDLNDGDIDFVFRIGKLKDSSLKSIMIENNDLVFCTNPKLHKKIPKNIDIKQLDSYPVMYLPFHGEKKVLVEKSYLKLKNIFQASAITIDSGETINQFAITSDVIALRSTWDINRYIAEGKLKIIKTINKVNSDSSVYALYSHRDYLPKKMKLFLGFLKSELIKKS